MKAPLILIVSIILSVLDLTWSQTNYCQASLCGSGKTHIGCNHNGAFAAKCGGTASVVSMTAAMKTAILQKHNTLRNKIASGGISKFQPAARMATMSWNDELASLALLNAKQCEMKHDACRATTQFPYAGQNLAYTLWSGSTKTAESIAMNHIQLWFDENKDATMSQVNSYTSNGKKVGHFTQMSLERATHVGCGIVRQTQGKATYQFMACNYAFITIINKPVYAAATKAASKCTTGTNPSFKALCSVKEVYNVKKP